ncbi:amidohydrolase [Pseudonocardia eucalypti]|uniref:amidohydrolase n=1 Tax=Pseudonocardia eucalypti TaxID=648755 RepID=UPI00160F38E5
MPLAKDAAALQPDLVRLRRALHRQPEVGLSLPRSQEAVVKALDGLPLEVRTGNAVSSVVGVLRGGAPAPARRSVLLRGDMDALPLAEKNGLDYRSQTADTMHACGHDLHTSMLVGAARLLSAHREKLAGDVVFMFQPGEEGFDGAGKMIAEGVLDAAGQRPVAAYALHVGSTMPLGSFVTRRGPMLSASDTLKVTVHGKGGHGAVPYQANDPIPVASEMVTALQAMVTRQFSVFDPVICTVGLFQAGTKSNVIPDQAHFEATVRTYSTAARDRFIEQVTRLLRGIADSRGMTVDAVFSEDHYDVTVNNAGEAEFLADTVAQLHGAERFAWLPDPLTPSEDFSKVLAQVPGAMAMLGACPPGRDPATAPANHSPLAEFDDAVMADGAAVLAELALRRLVS